MMAKPKMTDMQKQIYRDLREGLRTGNVKLVERMAQKLYRYETKAEKEIIKSNLSEYGKQNPAKAYGTALADSLLKKANARGTLTKAEIQESQKYFGLKLTDEQRGGIVAMKSFRRTQRKDYEAFRRLAKAPNSFEKIGKELQYMGGNQKNGYKYKYIDQDGNEWIITTPKYDAKEKMTVGFQFYQDGKIIPDEGITILKGGYYQ